MSLHLYVDCLKRDFVVKYGHETSSPMDCVGAGVRRFSRAVVLWRDGVFCDDDAWELDG